MFDKIACFRTIYFEKEYLYILALEMASRGNQHRASCIGTLSFPTDVSTAKSPRHEERRLLLTRQRCARVMVWYGMVNVDLYSAIITKVSNALNTLVSGEKPGFQAL